MIALLDVASFLVINAWIWSGNVMRYSRSMGRRTPAASRIFHELRPLYWPAIVGDALTSAPDGFSAWDPFRLGCWVLCWYLLRNERDDDDRWKRRKQKLAEKVSVTAGGLKVVPVGGGS